MIRYFLLFAVSLFSSLQASAANDSAGRLAAIPTFTMGQVGFIAHIGEGERLYREVLDAPDALSVFQQLIGSSIATPEAKLYALCGLQEIDQRVFTAASRGLENSALEVSVLRADVMRKEKLAHWIQWMKKFKCQLESPG